MAQTKKLYLFRDVLRDYTPGIAGAIASSKKEAIKILVAQYTADQKIRDKKNKYLSRLYDSSDTNQDFAEKANEKYPVANFDYVRSEDFETELKNAAVTIHDLNDEFGFYNSGGS